MKHIHLDMVRVTEAAAIAASQQVGRGDKIAADYAATEAMRDRLNKLDFAGKIVIGEGKKDNAPGLFADEMVGTYWHRVASSASSPAEDVSQPHYYDIAVDPLEGTTPTARGGYEAMSVVAVGDQGSLFSSHDFYMNKLAVGPKIASKVDLNVTDPITRTIRLVSLATDKPPTKITVCVLDRPRHTDIVAELRHLGCRIRFIQDCDVSGALATALPESGIDLYVGIGGTPEGVIAACALKCMGGMLQGMLCGKDGEPVDGTVLKMEDLAKGSVMFCATGVTDGSLLKGVRYTADHIITNSVLMRSESGTVRWITGQHGIGKK